MDRSHTQILLHRNKSALRTIATFNNFVDGDTHCVIENAAGVKGAQVLIRHCLYPNQNEQIVRLLLLVGALRDFGAKSVEVFVPYLPYARQDKAHLSGEAISSRLLCKMLRVNGIKALHTIDCHFMKGAPKTKIEGLTIFNILVQDKLQAALETIVKEPYLLMGPDAGSAYLTQGQSMKKTRVSEYGQTADGSLHRAVESVDDTHLVMEADTIVIADDMVSTGSTMIQAIGAARRRGVVNVYAMTTHGLFLQDSLDKVTELTRGVIFSDTIAREGSVPVVDATFASLAAERGWVTAN